MIRILIDETVVWSLNKELSVPIASTAKDT